MAAPTLIVNVTITKSTRVVQQQAFNVPAIFGPSNRLGSNPYLVFTSASAMLAAQGGPFQSSDPEYIKAVALMSQAIKPAKFVVLPFTAAVAQVDSFAVNTLTVGHAYHFLLNGVSISYTAQGGDAQEDVLAGILAAIGTAFPTNPPVTGAVTGSAGSALLTLTSTVAGLGIAYASIDVLLTHSVVTANHSIADDIAAGQAVVTTQAQFYGVLVCSQAAADILQVAAYVETQLLVYVTATADSAVKTNSQTDVCSLLKSKSYSRTLILYSAEANTAGPDAAWMGYMLPTTPGIGNWAMKTLVGIDADNLSPTEIANIQSKNANIYVVIAGNGTTLSGITPAGEFIDVTIFIDWLGSTIQTGVIAVETDPLNLKIPYTNQGITMLENPIRAALQKGQDNQGLVPGWTVFAPNVIDVPKADKSNRTLNGLGFEATLAGAINQINIAGFVSS